MAGKSIVNVALIGQKFMGRTHSNAWSQVVRFFDVPVIPVQHTICGRQAKELEQFGAVWGWLNTSTNWRETLRSPEIDLVDIGTPNNVHAEMAIAALEAGKHVACEKPLAGTLEEARSMRAAARRHPKCRTYVWYNYRRCPAVALAHQLVKAGKLGPIRHVRAVYLQDWAKPQVPLIWRFDRKVAGSGSNGDLNAHIVDMARFITGEEIVEIAGAAAETFVKQRPLPSAGSAGGIAHGASGSGKMGKVTVDDAIVAVARLSGGGLASFEATRFATGNKNRNRIEIDGEKGSLLFDFQRMNYLDYYDATANPKMQGWTSIMCTHKGDHPYIKAWWPDAHIIGYEHTFTNMAYDITLDLAGQPPIVPLPNFEDAYQTQRVLEAMAMAAREKRAVRLSQVK